MSPSARGKGLLRLQSTGVSGDRAPRRQGNSGSWERIIAGNGCNGLKLGAMAHFAAGGGTAAGLSRATANPSPQVQQPFSAQPGDPGELEEVGTDPALALLQSWDTGEAGMPAQLPGSRAGCILAPWLPSQAAWQPQLRQLGVQWPPAPPDDLVWRQRQLRDACRDMQGPEKDLSWSHPHYLSQLAAQLQPEAGMQGGQWNKHVQVWEQLAEELGSPSDDMEWALETLRQGVQLEFCAPHHPRKVKEPLHNQKVAGVRRSLLQAGWHARAVDQALLGHFPPPAHLHNRLHTEEHVQFARSKVSEGLAAGVMLR
jgi:hypothetical protein